MGKWGKEVLFDCIDDQIRSIGSGNKNIFCIWKKALLGGFDHFGSKIVDANKIKQWNNRVLKFIVENELKDGQLFVGKGT